MTQKDILLMFRNLILFWILFVLYPAFSLGQVKVRLFSVQSPESAVFSVTEGKYEVKIINGETLFVTRGEPAIISRYDGKLAVKTRSSKGFVCDSVLFKGITGEDFFSLRSYGNQSSRQYYSGDLQCFPDLGTIVLINTCAIEKYISGVVKAEGGSGKILEYFKTQAVIARTYMYKYFDKHLSDRYNLCDNTHCQAFNGLTSDTIINRAALETGALLFLIKIVL